MCRRSVVCWDLLWRFCWCVVAFSMWESLTWKDTLLRGLHQDKSDRWRLSVSANLGRVASCFHSACGLLAVDRKWPSFVQSQCKAMACFLFSRASVTGSWQPRYHRFLAASWALADNPLSIGCTSINRACGSRQEKAERRQVIDKMIAEFEHIIHLDSKSSRTLVKTGTC